MTKPECIKLNIKEVRKLLRRLEKTLTPEDMEIIQAMADTVFIMSQSLDKKNASIQRLLRMIFGAATEKRKKSGKKKKKQSSEKKEKKGHGRNGADDYPGAERKNVTHDSLKPGDNCPDCSDGKLYELQPPKKVVRITGTAPLSAIVYEMQRLRCNLCGRIFTADTPAEAGDEKYDSGARALNGILKYGAGLPFNRLANIQKSLGIPLPASTQFDILAESADLMRPVLNELIRQAAQGHVVYNDDTTMKVLELMQEKDPKRKGIFTTGILSTTDEHKIALFFTGRQHAGENLEDILKKREGRSPPVQMCDALSRNVPKAFETILANCLAHGRRQFVEMLDNFPEECNHVLEKLSEVYRHDQVAREKMMTRDERLRYHQENSGPVMSALNSWLNTQIDQHLVEPNSGLGQAIAYMLKHWEPLTLFLRKAGAPLDNNICERALKKAILHRKNALFYKTLNGARVGDLFMSLIHTCSLGGVNPMKYITALIDHAAEVKENPQKWLPWNYAAMLQVNLS